MEENKSGEVVDIEVLRIKRNLKKICSCKKHYYEVDVNNRAVWCRECGAWVDPFDAIANLAEYPEKLREQNAKLEEKQRQLIEEVRNLDGKRARLKVFKEIESSYRHDMLPHCPKCGELFHLEKLSHWTNRAYCGCDVCKRS